MCIYIYICICRNNVHILHIHLSSLMGKSKMSIDFILHRVASIAVLASARIVCHCISSTPTPKAERIDNTKLASAEVLCIASTSIDTYVSIEAEGFKPRPVSQI